MTRSDGWRPRNQAGIATDAHSDFSVRGGKVMMRRRTSPFATCDSFSVTASKCQFGLKNAGPNHAKGKFGKRCQVVRKEDLKDNLRGIVGQGAGVEGIVHGSQF
jgi:hypothetical protein